MIFYSDAGNCCDTSSSLGAHSFLMIVVKPLSGLCRAATLAEKEGVGAGPGDVSARFPWSLVIAC